MVDECVFLLNPENSPVEELTQDMRRKLIQTLLEKKVRSIHGNSDISDALKYAAEQLARSFLTRKAVLKYEFS